MNRRTERIGHGQRKKGNTKRGFVWLLVLMAHPKVKATFETYGKSGKETDGRWNPKQPAGRKERVVKDQDDL